MIGDRPYGMNRRVIEFKQLCTIVENIRCSLDCGTRQEMRFIFWGIKNDFLQWLAKHTTISHNTFLFLLVYILKGKFDYYGAEQRKTGNDRQCQKYDYEPSDTNLT